LPRKVEHGTDRIAHKVRPIAISDLPAYAEQALSGAKTFALGYAAKDVTASRSELGVRTDKSWAMTDAIFTLRGRPGLGA
jgi:hypothetical protein